MISAREAAQRLGVSRKTFYKWEQRGLTAMLEVVADRSPGRPQKIVDENQQCLEKQLTEARRQIELLNHQLALKDVLVDLKLPMTGCDRAKKK